MDLGDLNARRAKHHKRLPVVLTQDETGALLRGVAGAAGLLVKLLYGCGLRVAEAYKTWSGETRDFEIRRAS